MATNPKAYVDTSALIAFADKSDSYHSLFKQLFSRPPALITTPLVIAEGHAWFLRRFDRHRALQFLAMIEQMKPLSIMPVGLKEQTNAAMLLRKFSDQNLTLVDAVGLYVMRTQKLKSCWSTDFHMGLTGVPLAIHAS
jgi:predicted nucleic acid-binding protein